MLNEVQYTKMAGHLKAESAAVKSVVYVESKGDGFLASGRPKILFEGHRFWKELKKAGIDPQLHVKDNEDILYATWTKKYYTGGEGEYARLEKAKKIHEECALKSASWGAFQIMGYFYASLGFATARDFVTAQQTAEGQVNTFLQFVRINPGMLNALRQKNWQKFARLYNGKDYKANRYDVKLKEKYDRIRRNPVVPPEIVVD